jgi:hypothetical protein
MIDTNKPKPGLLTLVERDLCLTQSEQVFS